jgi:hypothetical protein
MHKYLVIQKPDQGYHMLSNLEIETWLDQMYQEGYRLITFYMDTFIFEDLRGIKDKSRGKQ